MKLGYLGIDQYGQHYNIKAHPRKELLGQLGRKHADKMYRDTKDGKGKEAGYVIGGLWIDIHEIHGWSNQQVGN